MLIVDEQALGRHVETLALIGADSAGGVTRPSYSALERQAHGYVAEQLERLGAEVIVDPAGNTLGVLPGTEAGLSPILTGSHLDTVPNGGRYDGVVGVIAGLEAVRAIKESGVTTRRPIGVVVFAGEEGGSWFGEGRLGSQMLLGHLGQERLDQLRNDSGHSVLDAMKARGLRPQDLSSAIWHRGDVAGFVEVHIEQGKTLERVGVPIGVVTGIIAATRLRLTVTGRADHAGGTPMSERRDALLAASRMVIALHEVVGSLGGPHAVGNVGNLKVSPGSVTVVPSKVVMIAEFRDLARETKQLVRDHLLERLAAIAEDSSVELQADIIADNQPVAVPEHVQEMIELACAHTGASHRRLPSGGGHDAAHMAEISPTGMIFIPCRDGVSHHPAEFAAPEHIATATRVLAHTLLKMDAATPDGTSARQG